MRRDATRREREREREREQRAALSLIEVSVVASMTRGHIQGFAAGISNSKPVARDDRF